MTLDDSGPHMRWLVLISVTVLAVSSVGCAARRISIQGGRPWVVITDRDSVLAWRLGEPDPGQQGEAPALLVTPPPDDLRWLPNAELGEFARKNWHSDDTIVILTPLRESTDPGVTRLLRDRRILYLPTGPLNAMNRTKHVVAVLESAPVRERLFREEPR
jgi:hypothetical protein